MRAEQFRAFVASADACRLRAPYVRVEMGPPTPIDPLNAEIIGALEELTERAKLLWLCDCIEHAAEILQPEARVAAAFLGLSRAIIRGEYMPADKLAEQIRKYEPVAQQAAERAKAHKTEITAAVTSVLFSLGILLGYLFRVTAWFEAHGDDPAWSALEEPPPLWHILDGTAGARGGLEERRWQVGAMARHRAPE